MRQLFVIPLILAMTLFSASASATDGNLIVNGDFEANSSPWFPDVPSYTWTWYPGTYFDAWLVENTFPAEAEYPPRLEIWDRLGGHQAASGTQYIELDGYDPTTISQMPATDVGRCYELSYAWSPRPDVSNNQLAVYLDDVEIAYHSASGGGTTQWTWETFEILAAYTSTSVAFAEVGPDDQVGMLLDAVSLAPCPSIPVDIDVKPGSYPNCVNPNGHGVIPVAILGSAEFDVGQIDPIALQFEGTAVSVKGNGNHQCSINDVSGDFSASLEGAPDGFDDLVCQFVDEFTDDWVPGDGLARVTGLLYDGTIIEGADSICVVP